MIDSLGSGFSVGFAVAGQFRIQQVGDQFAVGDEHDPGEQRQHVGQRIGVLPVSGRKNTCDFPEFGEIIHGDDSHQQQPKNKH